MTRMHYSVFACLLAASGCDQQDENNDEAASPSVADKSTDVDIPDDESITCSDKSKVEIVGRDLVAVSNLADMVEGGAYKLEGDIDLSDSAYMPGILNKVVFDGAGHKVKGLRLDKAGTDRWGLFREIHCSYVVNLVIEDFDVTVDLGGGALAGFTADSRFQAISVASSTVTGGGEVGGLLGHAKTSVLTGIEVRSTQVNGSKPTSKNSLDLDQHAGTAGGVVGFIVGDYGFGAKLHASASAAIVRGGRAGGLVGEAFWATISHSSASGNVNLEADGVTPFADDWVSGGLVGVCSCGVESSFATGAVGTGRLGGGLIGEIPNSVHSLQDVKGSYATGRVIGATSSKQGRDSSDSAVVGGLIGDAAALNSLQRSYATGDVSGARAGGLIGVLSHGEVRHSFSSGSVMGRETSGGLIGEILQSKPKSLEFVFAVGAITAGSKATGGLIATSDHPDIQVENAFWDMDASGQKETGANLGAGKSSDEMRSTATYAGWDDSVWQLNEGELPRLK